MIEGFYTTFFTGQMGSSVGIFTFKDGVIVGADIGGGRYDGTYVVDTRTQTVHCQVQFALQLGGQSITGAEAVNEPIKVPVALTLPATIDPKEIYRIDTAIGPVNARFEKLRDY